METEIKIGDMAKDVCGDIGEVVEIDYTEDGDVWRYILAEYSDDNECLRTWPGHPVYTYKVS